MDSPIRLHLERTSQVADTTSQQTLTRGPRSRRKPPQRKTDEEDAAEETKHEIDEQA